LDQGVEQGFIDLAQAPHARMGTKRVEDAHVGRAMAMAQPGKGAPSTLFG